jgi:hypothetical protein
MIFITVSIKITDICGVLTCTVIVINFSEEAASSFLMAED